MKTAPVTSALLGELAQLRDITGSEAARLACIEAQKGFGPSLDLLDRLREAAQSETPQSPDIISLQWRYGFCERFHGTFAEAEARILAEAEGGPVRKVQTQFGPQWDEYRHGPDGYEWHFIGAITLG